MPQHLQLTITTYRRQVDVFGVLDPAICRFLDQVEEKETNESVMAKLVTFNRGQIELKAGTILSRKWNDTIATSKKMEIWVGGPLPLGYGRWQDCCRAGGG